jgi:hypothetical protein
MVDKIAFLAYVLGEKEKNAPTETDEPAAPERKRIEGRIKAERDQIRQERK